MEPVIAVGICAEKQIDFCLEGIFRTENQPIVTGNQKAVMSPSGVTFEWNGENYTSLEFSPTSEIGDSFMIDGVTIGVRFHWERKERQRFRGSLRLIASEGKITVVNAISVEEYLKSVISSEMSATASLNLLRAHAVISRSWLLAQIEGKHTETAEAIIRDHDGERVRWWDRSNHSLFDVCADDHCQRYQGITRISSETAIGAVADTRGEVLMYDGKICDARFSKCCGGMLETFETCWDDTPHPYLASHRDTLEGRTLPDLTDEQAAREWICGSPESFCNTTEERILKQVMNNYDLETRDFYRWSVSYTAAELSDIFTRKTGLDLGTITDLTPLLRGKSGRISRLQVTGTKGSVIMGKELEIRRALSESHLYSSAFVVETTADGFTLRGAGWGHGVGLCQIGAAVMGDMGYDYRTILHHYYKDADISKIY